VAEEKRKEKRNINEENEINCNANDLLSSVFHNSARVQSCFIHGGLLVSHSRRELMEVGDVQFEFTENWQKGTLFPLELTTIHKNNTRLKNLFFIA
jgi:hypothetical protein